MPYTRSQGRTSSSQVNCGRYPKKKLGRPRKQVQKHEIDEFRSNDDCSGTEKITNSSAPTIGEHHDYESTLGHAANEKRVHPRSLDLPEDGTTVESNSKFARNVFESYICKRDDVVHNQSFVDMFCDEEMESHQEMPNFPRSMVDMDLFELLPDLQQGKEAAWNMSQEDIFDENKATTIKTTNVKQPVVPHNHLKTQDISQPGKRRAVSKPGQSKNQDAKGKLNVKKFKSKQIQDEFKQVNLQQSTSSQRFDLNFLHFPNSSPQMEEQDRPPFEEPKKESGAGKEGKLEVETSAGLSALPFKNFMLTLPKSSEGSTSSRVSEDAAMEIDEEREDTADKDGDLTEIIPASVEETPFQNLFGPWNWLQKDEQKLLLDVANDLAEKTQSKLTPKLFKNTNVLPSTCKRDLTPGGDSKHDDLQVVRKSAVEDVHHRAIHDTGNQTQVVSPEAGSTLVKNTPNQTRRTKRRPPQKRLNKENESQKTSLPTKKGIRNCAVTSTVNLNDSSYTQRPTRQLIKPSKLLTPQTRAPSTESPIVSHMLTKKVEALAINGPYDAVPNLGTTSCMSYQSLANMAHYWWRSSDDAPLSSTVPKMFTNTASHPVQVQGIIGQTLAQQSNCQQWYSLGRQGLPNSLSYSAQFAQRTSANAPFHAYGTTTVRAPFSMLQSNNFHMTSHSNHDMKSAVGFGNQLYFSGVVQPIGANSQTIKDYNSHPMYAKPHGQVVTAPGLHKNDSPGAIQHINQRDFTSNSDVPTVERNNHVNSKAQEAIGDFIPHKTPVKIAKRKSPPKPKPTKRRNNTKLTKQCNNKKATSSAQTRTVLSNIVEQDLRDPVVVSSTVTRSRANNEQSQPLDLTFKPRSLQRENTLEKQCEQRGSGTAVRQELTTLASSTTENPFMLKGQRRNQSTTWKESSTAQNPIQTKPQYQIQMEKEVDDIIKQIKYVRTPEECEYIEAANASELINMESLDFW